ncbi:OpgC domain-containing protein [Thiofilum flexile]|uniref:OpgC domain-containing protein n=1 Tax=Thiofilum flexile TaxID=125627 RepID=UPI000A045814|nr:OpgC domain-containing protein [Thiofilum flexile]
MQTFQTSNPTLASRRDISLDVLRGMMLFIMAMDHFGEPIMKYTWEMAGFVSAAEGFVFLSGLLVGLIYSRYINKPHWQLEKRIWQRAGTIYLYHWLALLGVFIFTLTSLKLQAPWQSYAIAMEQTPWLAWLSGMLLIYQPPMLDVLPLYVSLMLIAPLALRLMAQGRIHWVLIGSFVIWLTAQWDLRNYLIHLFAIDKLIVGLGSFDLLGWQLLFVLGMSVGFKRYQNQGAPLPIVPSAWSFALVMVIGLWLLRHHYIQTGWLEAYAHTDRESIAWLRLINFLALAYVIAGIMQGLMRFVPQFFNLGFVRWLAFLGQHSLQVFAFHLVLLYCYIPFRWGEYGLTDWQKAGVLVLFLASLTLPAWLHQRSQERQRSQVSVKASNYT